MSPHIDRHLVDLVHSGVCLEGALATRNQVQDILNRKSVNLSSKTIKKSLTVVSLETSQ